MERTSNKLILKITQNIFYRNISQKVSFGKDSELIQFQMCSKSTQKKGLDSDVLASSPISMH